MVKLRNNKEKTVAIPAYKGEKCIEKLYERLKNTTQPLKDKDIPVHLKIENTRKEIDLADREIVQLIEKRMMLVKKISGLKTEAEMGAFQEKRLEEILKTRPQWLTTTDFNPEIISEIFKLIHSEALNMQIKIKDENKE